MRPPETLPARDRGIFIGGLMRCCLAAIRQSIEPTAVDSRMRCPYCHGLMEVDPAGRWRWVMER